jgi:peptide/nickel transport system permease protein
VAYSLSRAGLILLLAVLLGTILGALSALYRGRLLDNGIVLIAETGRSAPTILFALLFASAGVPAWWVLVAYFWIPVWRLVRAALAAQKSQPYALSARLLGMSRLEVVLRELAPNALIPLFPYVGSLLAEILTAQCAIEFLGFGPTLDQPSLGGFLLEAVQLGAAAPWIWLPSLVAICAVVLCAWVWGRRAAMAGRWTPLE